MTLILKCGGVVYRVNVADTTSFCATWYVCVCVCVAYCGPGFVITGRCVALCGKSIEAGAIWSLTTGVPNVVHRYHKSESECKHEIDLRLQKISSQSSLSSLTVYFSC